MKKQTRRLTQVITAVLYNCNFTGFVSGNIYTGRLKTMCVPGLNCYSCPGAVGSCSIGALQSELISSKYRFPYYILGLLLLFGVLLGRFICGFLCPVGLAQELLYKMPTKKAPKNRITKTLTWIKYIVLAVLVIVVPIAAGIPGFCKYICPAGILEGGVFLAVSNPAIRGMLGALFSWKMAVLLAIAASAVFAFRSFCRFLCPLGAFYSLFNRVALVRMTVDMQKCTGCGACVSLCKMDIAKVGDRECIQCGECRDVCPEGAICRFAAQFYEEV